MVLVSVSVLVAPMVEAVMGWSSEGGMKYVIVEKWYNEGELKVLMGKWGKMMKCDVCGGGDGDGCGVRGRGNEICKR